LFGGILFSFVIIVIMARSDYKDAQQKVKDGATQAASGVKDSVGEVADNTRKDVQQTAEQADERFLLAVTSFFGAGKTSQN
jgi:uncharacterized protein YjbJ (UPF0337 family)